MRFFDIVANVGKRTISVPAVFNHEPSATTSRFARECTAETRSVSEGTFAEGEPEGRASGCDAFAAAACPKPQALSRATAALAPIALARCPRLWFVVKKQRRSLSYHYRLSALTQICDIIKFCFPPQRRSRKQPLPRAASKVWRVTLLQRQPPIRDKTKPSDGWRSHGRSTRAIARRSRTSD